MDFCFVLSFFFGKMDKQYFETLIGGQRHEIKDKKYSFKVK